jgi:uncharacterized membrane protein
MMGFIQKSFTFQFGGLVGLILGPDDQTKTYSVISLGEAIPESLSGDGVMFLQGSYFFFTVIMPILCLMTIVVLMVCPMSLKYQRRLLLIAEITNAWSAVEVFLLSILAALFQIGTFSDFMVGHHCDLINDIARAFLSDNGDGKHEVEIVCFSVQASVRKNCWYLLVGVVLYSRLVSFSLRLAHASMNERLAQNASEEAILLDRSSESNGTYIDKIGRIPCVGPFLVADTTDVDHDGESVDIDTTSQDSVTQLEDI